MSQYDLSVWAMPDTGKKHNSLEIEGFIIDRIKNRAVEAFERIPSHRTLARLNKVNRNTALRAYTKLIATGWLTHAKGSAARVADPLPSERNNRQPLSMPETLPSSILKVPHNSPGPNSPIDQGFMMVGIPLIDKAYWPAKLFNRYSRESTLRTSPKLINANPIPTAPSLHTAVLQQLRLRGFNIRQEHLKVIRGRSESIRMLLRVISIPGDLMVNTCPSDRLVCCAMAECNVKMASLDMAADDFLTRLQQLIGRSRITALYIRPGTGYPHTRNLDEASCQKLVDLAKKHQFYIIEEDDDHEFWWGSFPLKPLAHYNHEGFVVYCGALSRVSPYMQHLRTLVAPSQLI